MEINLIYISLLKSDRIENLSFKGNFMKSAQIFTPVSVLSLIDIQKIAESYRRKSFGGTEKHNDRKDPNISYSFRPFWQSWKRENSCFFSELMSHFSFNEVLLKHVFFGFMSMRHLLALRQAVMKIPTFVLVWLAKDF